MDWHCLDLDEKRRYANVYFHIPITNPTLHEKAGAAGNEAMTLRTALSQYKEHNSIPDTRVYNLETTFPAEKTQLENCELYEHYEYFKFRNANWGKERKAEELDARFNQLTDNGHKDFQLKKIRQKLRMWSYNQDVS